MNSSRQKVKTSQVRSFGARFCDMNNVNQRLITAEGWKAFFFFFFLCLPSALFLPPLLCLPSSVAQPCSLPCCSSGAHRSARFWWLVSMSINWEISYYHENDFILRWTILYHLLYLSHRAQCCTLGRQINLSS